MTDDSRGSGARSRWLLVAVGVLLAGCLAAQGWYLYGVPEDEPTTGRPVVSGTVAHRSAVESAARSTSEILSYGFEDFDAQVEDATTQMTESFADEFLDSAAGERGRFLEGRITQEVRVVSSAVVTASDEEVRALLLLDQYVAEAGEGTTVTPYRALVTVRRGAGGWLVADIDTL